MARNDLGKDDALARIHSQMALREKRKHADYVIDNSTTITDTKLAVEYLHRQFQASYAHWKLRFMLCGTFGLGVAVFCVIKLASRL